MSRHARTSRHSRSGSALPTALRRCRRNLALTAARKSARLGVLATVSIAVVVGGSSLPASAAPLSVAAIKGAPTLSVGDRGQAVVYLQRKLRVKATGYYGAQTKAAVKRYEKNHDLRTDGIVKGVDWRWIGNPATAGAAKVTRAKASASAVRTTGVKAARSSARSGLPGSAAFGAKILALAKPTKGAHYRRGGNGPRAFDCSGLVNYVYDKAGISLPRSSAGIRAVTPKVAKADVRVGDLIFVHSSGGRVYHVGIYAGKGKWFEATNPRRPVGVNKAWSSNVTYGRVR